MCERQSSNRYRYLDVEMPEWFTLEIRDEKGRWWEHGDYSADGFVRREDGSLPRSARMS